MLIHSITQIPKQYNFNINTQPVSFAGKFKTSNSRCNRQDDNDKFTHSRDYNKQNNVNKSSRPDKIKPIKENKITDLFKYSIPCLCCGKIMIDPSEISRLEEEGIFKCNSEKAVKILSKYEYNMHDNDKKVFELLKKKSYSYPDKNFKEILQIIKPEHEKLLMSKQLGMLRLIDNKTKFLERETRHELLAFLADEKEKIYKGDHLFKRQRFITKLDEILKKNSDVDVRIEVLKIAEKLPAACDDIDAFIVKYADTRADAIALRLLTFSSGTVEHLMPNSLGGKDNGVNYALECMECNNSRGDKNFNDLLAKNPQMFANAQKQIDKLIKFANRGILDKKYIIHLKNALSQVSDNVLLVDTNELKLDPALKKIVNRPVRLVNRKKQAKLAKEQRERNKRSENS